jgi:hypothetical protein
MKITRLLLLSALIGTGAACSSSDSTCGDGGCLDASFNFDAAAPDAGPSYTPASGKYKVTAYTAGQDECKFGLDVLTNSSNPDDWIQVTVDGTGKIKIGNPKGTPAMASLGEGTIVGSGASLTRSNHVAVGGGSTCNYDEVVTSTAAFDDPAKKTIGLSVSDKLTNRTTCDVPAGVGMMCTSTWSWRLTPQP